MWNHLLYIIYGMHDGVKRASGLYRSSPLFDKHPVPREIPETDGQKGVSRHMLCWAYPPSNNVYKGISAADIYNVLNSVLALLRASPKAGITLDSFEDREGPPQPVVFESLSSTWQPSKAIGPLPETGESMCKKAVIHSKRPCRLCQT